MKGVQLDVGRVDMTLCKNASNGNMHVCFSRSAIVAGTESASHGLARASARRGRRFFKTNVTAALNRTKEGSLLGIVQNLNVFPSEERQEALKQSAGIGDEETRSRILQRSERPLITWRAFLPFALLWTIAGGMCRNGQKCPKLRTGPHATTKEATNMDVHALGRFRVPSRPTARRSGVPWHLRKTKLKDFYGITLLIPSAVIGDIHYAAYAASYAHLPGVRACLPSRPVDLFADQASAICSSYNAAP